MATSIEKKENRKQKKPTIHTGCGARVCVPFTSCRIMFVEGWLHVTKWLIVPKLLWYHCPTGICIFTLCYVYQHHIL